MDSPILFSQATSCLVLFLCVFFLTSFLFWFLELPRRSYRRLVTSQENFRFLCRVLNNRAPSSAGTTKSPCCLPAWNSFALLLFQARNYTLCYTQVIFFSFTAVFEQHCDVLYLLDVLFLFLRLYECPSSVVFVGRQLLSVIRSLQINLRPFDCSTLAVSLNHLFSGFRTAPLSVLLVNFFFPF